MRVVFMGSPDFAVPALRALVSAHEVCLVVTQPDKRAGRGKVHRPPPVKTVAEEGGIPVIQPPRARDPEVASRLAGTGADVGIVVAYGKILPPSILSAFPHGCLNIHASLLPKYRGAAPIQWAIIRGERETGVTIMRLDEGMDTGPMLVTRREPIRDDDTAGSLFARLAPIGAEALLEALDLMAAGRLVETPQDDAAATYAPMLTKEDGRIDWSASARDVANRIRGVDPWPGAFTERDGERLKLYGARPVSDSGPPGTVVAIDERGLVVACGDGACAVTDVQAPGKRRMSAVDFARGHSLIPGAVIG